MGTNTKTAKTNRTLNLPQSGKRRNDALFDIWSITHFATGVILGWLVDPYIAVAAMILWEPLEIFIISPFAARVNLEFGYESWRNSFSDIIFDTAGVVTGAWLLTALVPPAVHLF